MLCERAATAEVREGQIMVSERKAAGLPETPGRDEIEAMAAEGVKRALRDGYFVDEGGGLHTYEWILTAHTRARPKTRPQNDMTSRTARDA